MSTVARINLEPVGDMLTTVVRRDFALANPALVDPSDGATGLIDGEWLTLDESSKLIRATTIGSVGNEATKRSFPLWAERGRTDILAMANRKCPIIMGGWFEFDTRIFDATAEVGSGVVIDAVMLPLKVATITIGSRNFSGLVGHGGSADSALIVGYVTRLPTNNGGKLRFMSGSRN